MYKTERSYPLSSSSPSPQK